MKEQGKYSEGAGLFDSFHFRGRWWLPNRPDNRVHGTVYYSLAGISLELDGIFDLPEFRNREPEVGAFRSDCILGMSLEGDLCTILRVFFQEQSSALILGGHELVIGAHCGSDDEIISGALISYTNLEEWAFVPTIRSETSANVDHFVLSIPILAKSLFTVNETFPFRKLELLVGVESSQRRGAFSAQATGYFECEFLGLLSVRTVKSVVRQLGNLLSILEGQATYATRIRLLMGSEPRPPVAELFQVPNAQALPSSIHGPLMPLSFKTLAEYTASLFASWFTNEELLGPVYNLLLSTMFHKGQPLETFFLSLMHAIETFHRRAYGGTYMSKASYEPIRELLVGGVPSGLGQEFEKKLKDMMEYGYQYSLRTRLKELLRSLKPETKTRFLEGDEKDFIDLVVKIRNYLTHYDETNRPSILDDIVKMYNLNRRLRALLIVLLLKYQSVPEDKAAAGVGARLDLAY